MSSAHSAVGALVLGTVILVQACGGGGGGGSGAAGKYVSVGDDALSIELKPGGGVVLTAAGVGASSGTYVLDGEKLIITVEGQKHTLVRDGDCIADQVGVFGKMCKGGKAGEAANVSTRSVPATPSGTYVATNTDGQFTIEFKPGNTLKFTATQAGGGKTETGDGTFTVQGDEIYATLPQGVPLVLKFVNNTYESTSFGPMMVFIRK